MHFWKIIKNPISDLEKSSPFIKTLLEYDNIKFKTVTIDQLSNGTVAEHFFKSGKFSKTKYYANNLSNIFRLLILHKYSGIYLDMDVIVKGRLDIDALPSNFACAESPKKVNNAVLRIDDKLGKNFTLIFLKWVFLKSKFTSAY